MLFKLIAGNRVLNYWLQAFAEYHLTILFITGFGMQPIIEEYIKYMLVSIEIFINFEDIDISSRHFRFKIIL